MIPEEDEARRKRPPQQGERDTLAERRARRAWLGDAALLRRAEAAEATVRTLEAHLADLRRQQVEAEHEHENAAAQLAERDRELRRVKQREYAEQQLRVEAEEAVVRVRRGHRVELDRLQRRAEEAHAAAQRAEEQRDALAVRLAGVGESCARLEQGISALQGLATELRVTFERDHLAAQARIHELEGELEGALARAAESPDPQRVDDEEALRREQMTGALAAAVERLRTRVTAGEPSESGSGESGISQTGMAGVGTLWAETLGAERLEAETLGAETLEAETLEAEMLGAGMLETVMSESEAEMSEAGMLETVMSESEAEMSEAGMLETEMSESEAEMLTREPSVADLPETSLPESAPAEIDTPQTCLGEAGRANVGRQATASVEGVASQTSPAQAHGAEVRTVIVVPRLFPAPGRYALRLAPAVRRMAVRLAAWADRAQDPPR